jgi:14-3-3 protein epsilon
VKGVTIKVVRQGLFLFHFGHVLDMEAVLKGGSWNFDNNMLIVERVQLGMQIESITLNHVNLWVQIHDLPMGLMTEKVGTRLANYIRGCVEYDKNNDTSFWRKYMRIRVRIDVRQPLKKNTKVKNKEGEWCLVNFKYERLGVFCFVCGIMGHTENKCEVRFAMENDDGRREWSGEIRAETRGQGSRPISRWLKTEAGSSAAGSNPTATTRNHDDVSNREGPTRDQVMTNALNSFFNNAITTHSVSNSRQTSSQLIIQPQHHIINQQSQHAVISQ